MIHTNFDAYRVDRLEVIQFLVNFGFSSVAILDFEKWSFDTSGVWAVSRRSYVPNLVRIRQTVRELFTYFFFKFQNGGRLPSWVMIIEILGPQACSVCKVDDTDQTWCI